MVEDFNDEMNKETLDAPYIEKELEAYEETQKRNWIPIWIFIGVIVIGGIFIWYRYFWEKAPVAPVEKKVEVVTPEPVPEPKPEESVTFTEGQQKFNEMFTEALLKDALANAGKEFDLTMFRNMVRIAMNAEFIGNRPGITWEKWQKEKTKVQEMARKELADPEFLSLLWKQYGGVVVTAVKASGKSETVKKLCSEAIPYFSGELPHSEYVQLDSYYKTDAKLEREIQKRKYSKDAIHVLTEKLDKKYRDLQGAGLNDTDVYFFEFSMRRIKEGGRELAKAYADILLDLKESL
ncbi:MAG: hypothetical protein CO090_01960 [Acidobacteria bacterium CG_4_9_14_3_um_filter_49_7]|nr:MAG: hypothetical protein CO090_01960 [Acidobacteria bacterium CG_4_9_14_3_um_filter_49_7]